MTRTDGPAPARQIPLRSWIDRVKRVKPGRAAYAALPDIVRQVVDSVSPEQMITWLPDGTRSRDYRGDKTAAQWAWEYLRRSPFYAASFAHAELLRATHGVVPPVVVDGQPLPELKPSNAYNAFYIAAATYFRMRPALVESGAEFRGEVWVEKDVRFEDKGGVIALYQLPDPRSRIVVSQHDKTPAARIFSVHAGGRRGELFRLGTGNAIVVIDLRQVIKGQIAGLSANLVRMQKAAAAKGEIEPAGAITKKDHVGFLRACDAVAHGASLDTVAELLGTTANGVDRSGAHSRFDKGVGYIAKPSRLYGGDFAFTFGRDGDKLD